MKSVLLRAATAIVVAGGYAVYLWARGETFQFSKMVFVVVPVFALAALRIARGD
jgi:hypothetical protein